MLHAAMKKFAKMLRGKAVLRGQAVVGGPVALTTPLSTGPAAVGPGLAMRRLKMKMKISGT
jgi:hypothetical protein